MKSVPDLVEEIELTADETGVDSEYLTFVLSEWDAQALEEALLLKEASGAEVVAVGLADDPEVDQLLYTALAKGVDAAVKIAGTSSGEVPGPARDRGAGRAAGRICDRAALLAGYLAALPAGQRADLVVTGVQAADDLDGQLPSALAALLDLPHVSVVVSVEVASAGPGGGVVTVRQEHAGGRSHELSVQMPAVIGVQSARQAPRYAPVTRIRQAMQAGGLAELVVPPLHVQRPMVGDGLVVRRMHQPEATGQAEMLTGSAADVADQIVDLLRARGLVKKRTEQ
jgi:electron transfer flavoprotein beta subunit